MKRKVGVVGPETGGMVNPCCHRTNTSTRRHLSALLKSGSDMVHTDHGYPKRVDHMLLKFIRPGERQGLPCDAQR